VPPDRSDPAVVATIFVRCGKLFGMDAVLHRIEGLPGDGRYAVTFRRADGSEQTAVGELADGALAVAAASLPTGWTSGSAQFAAVADAVQAFDAARRLGAATAQLRDVAGGWDVSLGNVVPGPGGRPVCTAHGEMGPAAEGFVCAECGARALLG
jgi:hypothetical protein